MTVQVERSEFRTKKAYIFLVQSRVSLVNKKIITRLYIMKEICKKTILGEYKTAKKRPGCMNSLLPLKNAHSFQFQLVTWLSLPLW